MVMGGGQMPALSGLAVVIKVPPEAVVPLLVGSAALLVLLFAGAALKDWKAKNPALAAKVGMVIAVALTGYALYLGARIVPAKYIDHGAPGETTIGFLDGPMMGFSALIGTLFWRFANQPKVALATGLIIGLVMFVKPFILPLHGWYEGHEHPWHFFDPEHLSFHGPGLAVIIAGLIAGKKPQ
jgi:hypothetical protein